MTPLQRPCLLHWGPGGPSSRRHRPTLGPLRAPSSLSAPVEGAVLALSPAVAVALAPAVALVPAVAEARLSLLAWAVHKDMAMDWPLQVKLSKPTNVLQHKRKQEMWYVIKSSLPLFQCIANGELFHFDFHCFNDIQN